MEEKDIMNRAQLIEVIAATCGTKTAANNFINAFIDAVINATTRGKEVRLVGFGTFKPVTVAAHIAHNPQTGETIEVPAKNTVKFVPGKNFKELLNC